MTEPARREGASTGNRSIIQGITEWESGKQPVSTIALTFSHERGNKIRIWTYEHGKQLVHLLIYEEKRQFVRWETRVGDVSLILSELYHEKRGKNPVQFSMGIPSRIEIPFLKKV